jgi:hypothetical protein
MTPDLRSGLAAHPKYRASPAEVSRARGRPAFAARRLPSGVAHVRDVGDAGAARKRPVTGASPQPDPLGHLMSRDPGAPDGESGAVRRRCPPPERLGQGSPPRITPRKPSRVHGPPTATRFREVARNREPGPRHPSPREEVRDRLHPRCLPSRGHPDVEHRAFALVRRSGGAFSTDCHQPVENTRRRCQDSLTGPRSGPAALTGCRRRGVVSVAAEWAGARSATQGDGIRTPSPMPAPDRAPGVTPRDRSR